ncbi:hypothetical protein PPACK8108_LOCUS148 [Phakopsora pachyrhizi]|uniref:Uncharacterized protein n=1 Tax=Phakopsora pachyrhizi TaxID=170000 RepID=A0AAV0ACX7_PHAPC|nr:hypothetical protein PPACK8108_LOCUS148 [Phakopsora pachyrhizi]
MDPWASTQAWDDDQSSSYNQKTLPTTDDIIGRTQSVDDEVDSKKITSILSIDGSSSNQVFSWQTPDPVPPQLNLFGWGVPSPTLRASSLDGLDDHPTLPQSSETEKVSSLDQMSDPSTPKISPSVSNNHPTISRTTGGSDAHDQNLSPHFTVPADHRRKTKSTDSLQDSSDTNSEEDFKTPEASDAGESKDETRLSPLHSDQLSNIHLPAIPSESQPPSGLGGWDQNRRFENSITSTDQQASLGFREPGWPSPPGSVVDDQDDLGDDSQDPWSTGQRQNHSQAVGLLELMFLNLFRGSSSEAFENAPRSSISGNAGFGTETFSENSTAMIKTVQSAISSTVAAATNATNSPILSRSIFSLTRSSSIKDSTGSSDLPSDQALPGDCLGSVKIPSDVPEQPQSGKAANKKTGFFGLWVSKPSTTTEASTTNLTAENFQSSHIGDNPIADVFNSSLKLNTEPKDTIVNLLEAGSAPSLSQSAPPDQSQDQSASRMSRLLGRFGKWSKNSPTDVGGINSPTTELTESDIKFLDSVSTQVPVIGSRNGSQPPGVDLFDLLLSENNSSLITNSPATSKPQPSKQTSLRSKPDQSTDFFDFPEYLDSSDFEKHDRRPAKGPMKLTGHRPPTLLEDLGLQETNQSEDQSKDDIDDLFSEFQSSVNNRIQSYPRATQSKTPTIDSRQKSPYGSSPLSGSNLSRLASPSNRPIAQVRMATSANTNQRSQSMVGSSFTNSPPIPILAPPPLPPGSSVPIIPRPQSLSPSLLPSNFENSKPRNVALILPVNPLSSQPSLPSIAPPQPPSSSVTLTSISGPQQSSRLSTPLAHPTLATTTVFIYSCFISEFTNIKDKFTLTHSAHRTTSTIIIILSVTKLFLKPTSEYRILQG